MKVKISTQGNSWIIDIDKSNLSEILRCIELQYPEKEEGEK